MKKDGLWDQLKFDGILTTRTFVTLKKNET